MHVAERQRVAAEHWRLTWTAARDVVPQAMTLSTLPTCSGGVSGSRCSSGTRFALLEFGQHLVVHRGPDGAGRLRLGPPVVPSPDSVSCQRWRSMSTAPIAVRDLALISGLFAANAPALIAGARPPSSTALLEYSQLSRRLLKQWWQSLEPPAFATGSSPLVSLAEEILVCELTSRIVAGVFAICDARGGRRLSGPFARAALLDLMQAKHWVLSRLVAGTQPLGALLRINQLRRKTERWCDCLLGNLPESHAAAQFAVDANRMQEFARRSTGSASHAAQYLTLVSLRLAMPASLVQDAGRCQTHREMMRSLIAFWPPAAFDSNGLLRGPLWQRLRGLSDVPPAEGTLPVPSSTIPEFDVVHRRLRPRAPLRDDDEPRR